MTIDSLSKPPQGLSAAPAAPDRSSPPKGSANRGDKAMAWAQACIDRIGGGALIVDENLLVQCANESAGVLLGTSTQSMLGRSVRVLLGATFHPRLFLGEDNYSPLEADSRLRVPRISVRAQSMLTDGEVSYLVLLKDHNKRMHSRIEARRNALRAKELAFLADRISAFVLTFHPQFGIDWCNEQTEIMTGFGWGQVIGKSFAKALLMPEDSATVKLINDAVDELRPFHFDTQVKHASKPPLWSRIEAYPLLDDSGLLEKYILTGSDITDERRDKEIQNHFCSMVSHELRTPLTVVSGTLETLEHTQAGNISPDAVELIAMGRRNCSHLSVLIEDVLQVNQLDTDDIPMSLQPVDVLACVHAVVDTMQPLFHTSGHHLQVVATHEDAFNSRLDPDRVRQILTNLLTNARKFSEPGAMTTVSVILHDNEVTIEVADQGCGIPLAFQSELFERFSRDVSVRARGIEGFGLGLAITKKLVEQMHGAINFESAEGLGTTFFITFPAQSVVRSTDTSE